jgi:hypothetical protein
VQVAGDEPLVARRSIELPEAFLRADRRRQTTRMGIAGSVIILMLGLVVAGAIFAKRRRPILVDDGSLGRKDTYLLLGGLAVLAVLNSVNGLRSKLFDYDTAQAWSSFLTRTAVGFVGAIPLVLVVFGLWLALGAMRRRAGIPMVAGEPSRSAGNDLLIAGLGLGSIFFILSQLDAYVPGGGMPRTPTTSLNDLFPLLAGVLNMPITTLMGVAMFGIPFLVAAALTRRWSLRLLMASAFVALLLVSAWSTSSGTTDINPVRGALAIAGLASLSVALVFWGGLAAWSWIVAALAYQGLGGLRNAAYGVVWQERAAGALTLMVALGVVALIARQTARAHKSA